MNEHAIISEVIRERQAMCGNTRTAQAARQESLAINDIGRSMIRKAQAGRIHPGMSDHEIAQVVKSGLFGWILTRIIWHLSTEFLLWIISQIRRRIWA